MKSLRRTGALLATLSVLALPSLALAAGAFSIDSNGNFSFVLSSGSGTIVCTAGNICYIASIVLFIINQVLVPVIFAISFITFIWGVAKAYIISEGEEREKGHTLILWGIIGFAVMVSLWGLVNVAVNTFGLSGYSAPPTPTSY